MMPISELLLGSSDWLAGRLLAGSVESALFVGVVWLACRRVASLPAWVRTLVWWLVSLKLVLAFAPVPALRLPVLPAREAASSLSGLSTTVASTSAHAAMASPPHAASEGAMTAGSTATSTAMADARVEHDSGRQPEAFPWAVVLVGMWVIGVVAQGARLVRAHGRLSGVVSRAIPVADQAWVPVARIARDIGLTSVPEVRLTPEIDTPQVTGIARPVVLLPEYMRELTQDEWAMTLCHELMHVRRRDLAWGWMPAIAERLFFFNPLARLASREYAVAREAACDAAVIRALDVAPHDYGRLLIRLGVTRAEPTVSAAGSSHSSSCLRRRLAMLDRTTNAGKNRWVPLLALAAFALAIVPVRLVATTPMPVPHVVGASPASPMTIADTVRDDARVEDASRPTSLAEQSHVDPAIQELLEGADGLAAPLVAEAQEMFATPLQEALALAHAAGERQATEALQREEEVRAVMERNRARQQAEREKQALGVEQHSNEARRRLEERVATMRELAQGLERKASEDASSARRSSIEALERQIQELSVRERLLAQTKLPKLPDLEALQQKISELERRHRIEVQDAVDADRQARSSKLDPQAIEALVSSKQVRAAVEALRAELQTRADADLESLTQFQQLAKELVGKVMADKQTQSQLELLRDVQAQLARTRERMTEQQKELSDRQRQLTSQVERLMEKLDALVKRR